MVGQIVDKAAIQVHQVNVAGFAAALERHLRAVEHLANRERQHDESSIGGSLVVSESFRLSDEDGRIVNIRPGTYEAKFKNLNDPEDIEFEIEQRNGDDVTAEFMLTANRVAPQNGSFQLSAGELGQSFSIAARHWRAGARDR